MSDSGSAYGLWGLVVLNSVVFIAFAATFFKPATGRDWRSLGMYSAFIVTLFRAWRKGGRAPNRGRAMLSTGQTRSGERP
jgi:hypothetical protein